MPSEEADAPVEPCTDVLLAYNRNIPYASLVALPVELTIWLL
jgi:hypothetical protein